MNKFHDLIVVGGGIVGAATARQVKLTFPKCSVLLVDKEHEFSLHQTGHNSGVIHSGIYYAPGSLEAKLCVAGSKKIYRYCDDKNVPYKKVGKLIVATRQIEVPRLENLFKRGLQNGVKDIRIIESEDIPKMAPSCRGLKAIHSPHTGIIDFAVFTRSLLEDFRQNGGQTKTDFEVTAFRDTKQVVGSNDGDSNKYPVTILGNDGKMAHARWVVTCGGLQSDRLAEMSGCSINPRIIPFRGEYLILKPERSNLVNMNIYPVPDPALPFLGVHCTPRMDGSVWLGPNAVLALSKETYARWPADLSISELKEYIVFPGLLRLMVKHFRYGLNESVRSIVTSQLVKEVRRFIPELQQSDCVKGPVGIRAQAVHADGTLVGDFLFDRTTKSSLSSRILHVRNAPSPAATSSMAIAEMITDKISSDFELNKLLQ